MALDPHHHAVRRDLADIRLADRVFAPHYASAVQRVVVRVVVLRETANAQSAEMGELAVGDVFEVLEFSNGHAWGVAKAQSLVGYVDADALSWSAP